MSPGVDEATSGFSASPLKRPFTEALNNAMPVMRMGNFWDASTLV
jgi:hypothetical protein